jgi:hypothetical protein
MGATGAAISQSVRSDDARTHVTRLLLLSRSPAHTLNSRAHRSSLPLSRAHARARPAVVSPLHFTVLVCHSSQTLITTLSHAPQCRPSTCYSSACASWASPRTRASTRRRCFVSSLCSCCAISLCGCCPRSRSLPSHAPLFALAQYVVGRPAAAQGSGEFEAQTEVLALICYCMVEQSGGMFEAQTEVLALTCYRSRAKHKLTMSPTLTVGRGRRGARLPPRVRAVPRTCVSATADAAGVYFVCMCVCVCV